MTDPFKITEPTVIAFSGGRTSAYLLWRVLQSNNGLPDDARAVFANTGKEAEETLEFVRDCAKNWNVHIDWVEYTSEDPKFKIVDFNTASRNGEPFEEVIKHYGKLPNPAQRWCTGILKIRTIHKFIRSLGWDHSETENSDFVGIRADEPRRAAKQRIENTPLVADGVTKKDIQEFWDKQDFNLKLYTIKGETIVGNCDLCFLKSPQKIMSIIKQEPQRADWWIKMESIYEGNGTASCFNQQRPKYKKFKEIALSQQDMFDVVGEDIPCFCGD